METIIRKLLISLLLIITTSYSLAHTIYAANDIPLLNNRFRIDPKTEQITFILNHSQGRQIVVLVRPDGSKIYNKNHNDSVAWVATDKLDIITIENPMAGPWQAIADLDQDNRIKLISKVKLKTNKLPLTLYQNEYITTYASLYDDDKLMTDQHYLSGAKLSVALIGDDNKQLALYKDDGKNYDSLPFDGSLTARMFVNIPPGRYLLNIRTKNDIFMRSENKDAVVFPEPITYKIKPLESGSEKAQFIFNIDQEEIDPQSVSIDGMIKDENNNNISQILLNGMDKSPTENTLSTVQKIAIGYFSFSGKAYATTRSGREIELQLTDQQFKLREKLVLPPATVSAAISTKGTPETIAKSLWENSWVLIATVITFILLTAVVVFIIIKRKRKNKLSEDGQELSLDELSMTELQSNTENLNPKKK